MTSARAPVFCLPAGRRDKGQPAGAFAYRWKALVMVGNLLALA